MVATIPAIGANWMSKVRRHDDKTIRQRLHSTSLEYNGGVSKKNNVGQMDRKENMAKETIQTVRHVPRNQMICKIEDTAISGGNRTMPDNTRDVTIRPWSEESQPGENRGQFLTRKWREILRMYPREPADRYIATTHTETEPMTNATDIHK